MQPRQRRRFLVIACGTLCAISLIAASAAVTALTYYNRVLPRTVIAGVNISNTNPTAALQALREKTAQLQQQQIEVVLEEKRATTSLADLGVVLLPEASEALITASHDPLLWAKPQFWRAFFAYKSVAIPYTLDEKKLQETLNQKLEISNTAQDATLAIEGATLAVKPAKNGIWLDAGALKQQLQNQLERGSFERLSATYTETQPNIPTLVAATAQQEILQQLATLTFSEGTRKFTLTQNDLFTSLEYAPTPTRFNWSVSKAKLRGLLQAKIADKINVRMIPRTVLTTTGEVTSVGREGRDVDLSALTEQAYRKITEKTTEETLSVPVKTVAITEKRVEPDYVAGLFPGLYVDISIKTQTMYIMDGTTKLQQFLISSGRAGTPTPRGVFYVKNKIELARSRLYPSLWMRKWNALAKNPDGSGYEGYGVHDLPCFNAECTLVEGASHLGRPVSHGCIRLGPTSAAWFYDNIPVGTPVHIH